MPEIDVIGVGPPIGAPLGVIFTNYRKSMLGESYKVIILEESGLTANSYCDELN